MQILVFNAAEQLQTVLSTDNPISCPFSEPVHFEKLATGAEAIENNFTLEIPGDHSDAQYLKEGALVAFLDLDANWQLFEVKDVTDQDTTDGQLNKIIYCEHALYELIDDIIEDKRPTNTSALLALTDALRASRWVVGTVNDLGTNSTRFYYDSALASVQNVAAVWKGELRFRVTIAGNQITGRYVDLLARRGTDTGKQFIFGKDITSVERQVDFRNVVTALYGRGKGDQVDTGGYGRRIDFSTVVWTTPTNPANKPAGQKWIEDTAAKAQYGLAGGTRNRFDVFVDEEETDSAKLLQKTWDELQRRKVPLITYTVDAVDLEPLSGLVHEAVRLGDGTACIDERFSPILQVSARVVAISRHLLDLGKSKFTLGNYRPDTGTTDAKQAYYNRQISDKIGVWDNATAFKPSVLDATIFELQNELRMVSGYVQMKPGEGVFIYDNPDPALATQALKLGGGIFAIANTKTSGQWNWRTFGTGAGFVADLLISGAINTGSVTINGPTSNMYWDSTGIYLKDPANPGRIMKITKDGIYLSTNNGVSYALSMNAAGIDCASLTTGTIDALRIVQAGGIIPRYYPNYDMPTINHWVANINFANTSYGESVTIPLWAMSGLYRWDPTGITNGASPSYSGNIPSIQVSTSYRLIHGACYQIHWQDQGTGMWSWQPPNYTGNGYIDSITVGGYTIDGSLQTGNIFFFVTIMGGVH